MKAHKRWVWIAVSLVMTVLLISSLIFNVWQSRKAEAISRRLNNIYDRTFFEITEGMSNIEVKLSKLLVSGSKAQIEQMLSDIVRVADQTTANLSALPLRHAVMGDTIKFTGQVSDYCQVLLKQVSSGNALSAEEIASLESLHARAAELSAGLQEAQNSIIDEPLAWDIESPDMYATPEAGGGAEAPFSDVGKGGMDYPALIYDGPFSDGAKGAMRGLGKNYVGEKAAIDIAKEFVGAERVTNITLTGESANPAVWSFDITTGDGGIYSLDVSKQGGHVLWMLGGASIDAVSDERPSYEAFARIGGEFLLTKGFGDMRPNYWQYYNGVVVVNYAAYEDDVLLYPDLVKVQLNQITGAVIGIEAHNYYTNHVKRVLPEAVLSADEARALVSDRLEIIDCRLCVIPVGSEEPLCYEFSGKFGDEDYLVYINAETGEEENILKIIHMNNGTLTL